MLFKKKRLKQFHSKVLHSLRGKMLAFWSPWTSCTSLTYLTMCFQAVANTHVQIEIILKQSWLLYLLGDRKHQLQDSQESSQKVWGLKPVRRDLAHLQWVKREKHPLPHIHEAAGLLTSKAYAHARAHTQLWMYRGYFLNCFLGILIDDRSISNFKILRYNTSIDPPPLILKCRRYTTW